MFKPRFICIWISALLGLMSACSPNGVEVVGEKDEKQYQLAQDYKTQGRTEEALSAFMRVIDARRDAPESHLEAGYIYLRTMKDPIRAIYHFQRYLQFKPQSPQAVQVRQLIETAQKEFARQLPAQPYEGDLDRIDLMELVKTLKQENESLKRDLVAAEQRVGQLENVVAQARRMPAPQSGTAATARQQPSRTPLTPSEISRPPDPQDVPPSRWTDIYQANRDRLSSENALRVGQAIRIP